MKRHEVQLLMDLQELLSELSQPESHKSSMKRQRDPEKKARSMVDVSEIKKGRSTFSVTYRRTLRTRNEGADHETR